MALVGRIYAITSECRLYKELRGNLAYRWFCRIAPGAAVPHHSTLPFGNPQSDFCIRTSGIAIPFATALTVSTGL